MFQFDCILNFPELKQDYINNKILVNRSNREHYSSSKEKGITFDKSKNRWIVKYFDLNLNKYKYKCFKNLEKAIDFKRNIAT